TPETTSRASSARPQKRTTSPTPGGCFASPCGSTILSRIGSSYDNALAETINGLYTTELIKPRKPWRTIEEVELTTAEWVHWFNHRRLYEYNADMPPAQLEAAYYAQRRRPAAG